MNRPRLMITAPSSGSGKSVISMALMAAYSRKEIVQGFKVGPDYIDPMYHTLATGRPSRNLDTWMLPPDEVMRIFSDASSTASLSIIEGVMGLFDGHGADPLDGSSASIAELLKCPAILVLDCAKMSGSAAAIVHGLNTFHQSLKLSGVICNRVGSEMHAAWLRESIEKYTSVPVLGCLPRLQELHIPERHLGLFTVAEKPAAARNFIEQATDIVSRYVDLDHLQKIAEDAPYFSFPEEMQSGNATSEPDVRLAVARDEAFCFYYEENMDELRRNGAQIVSFSPLTDTELPEDIHGLYFGGGYPELHAGELSRNQPLIRQIIKNYQNGMPFYAECGGLMYLTQGIIIGEESHPLAGILPGWCEMGSRLTMGYREVTTNRDTLLGPSGLHLRGHEFHYSTWNSKDLLHSAYTVLPRNITDNPTPEGYAADNLLASYIHLHFSRDGQLAHNFVNRSRVWKNTQNKMGDQ
jgi:cobyrinic acid a,c-diamide synthase